MSKSSPTSSCESGRSNHDAEGSDASKMAFVEFGLRFSKSRMGTLRSCVPDVSCVDEAAEDAIDETDVRGVSLEDDARARDSSRV